MAGGTVPELLRRAASGARRYDAHDESGARLHPAQQSDYAAFRRHSGGGLKIIARSFDTTLKSLTRSELTNVKLAASDKGLRLEVGEIPDELDENFLDFSQPHMQALFAAGEQRDMAATAFRTLSPETVATRP